MPRVTVIISTYNWSSVLPYSIGSVLRQTYDDWELLVIGDGCTDDSEAVVERVKREHPDSERASRVRWINLPANTGGQSGPNNEGLRQARGEYIAYLSHDDLWLPHHLACLVKALDAGAQGVHTIPRLVLNDIDGNRVRSPTYGPLDRRSFPSTVMHRRDVALKVGGWRDPRQLREHSDYDLWQRLAAADAPLEFVPRLTIIKLPAVLRRNVYKIRPCHEQAAWFERIGSEPDLEVTEMAQLLLEMQRLLLRPRVSLAAQYRALILRETPQRIRERIKFRLRQRYPEPLGAKDEQSRQLRGLEKRPEGK